MIIMFFLKSLAIRNVYKIFMGEMTWRLVFSLKQLVVQEAPKYVCVSVVGRVGRRKPR